MGGRVVLIGLAYAAIGIGSAAVANPAESTTRFAWRLGAWVASAAVFAAHVWYEHRLGNPPRLTALQAAWAAALGALGLAVSASVHRGQPLVLALVIWPIITGAPAFLLALAVAAVMPRAKSSHPPRGG